MDNVENLRAGLVGDTEQLAVAMEDVAAMIRSRKINPNLIAVVWRDADGSAEVRCATRVLSSDDAVAGLLLWGAQKMISGELAVWNNSPSAA